MSGHGVDHDQAEPGLGPRGLDLLDGRPLGLRVDEEGVSGRRTEYGELVHDPGRCPDEIVLGPAAGEGQVDRVDAEPEQVIEG